MIFCKEIHKNLNKRGPGKIFIVVFRPILLNLLDNWHDWCEEFIKRGHLILLCDKHAWQREINLLLYQSGQKLSNGVCKILEQLFGILLGIAYLVLSSAP